MADADVLAHIHIPKNGGSAVRVWLTRAYPTGFGSLYPDYDFDEEKLAAASVGDHRMRAFSTHSIRRFPAISCGRTMRYFTILRDPVEQYLSYVHYMKQVRAAIRDPAHLAELPPNLERISSREFTAWLLDQPLEFRFRENAQTNYLALHTWRERADDPDHREAYRRERLGIAQEILAGFAVAGTLERLPESLELLRRRSAAWGFQLRPAQEVGRENVTLTPRDDTGWVGEHDDVGRRLLDSMADDRALYAFAEQLLDEGLRSG